MNIKQRIQCPYCPSSAQPLRGPIGVPRFHGWTRYGCDYKHYFAVPTHTVTQRLRRAA